MSKANDIRRAILNRKILRYLELKKNAIQRRADPVYLALCDFHIDEAKADLERLQDKRAS